MEVRDAITLMIAFGVLIISLIGLVVNIVAAMTKKKQTAPTKDTVYFLTQLRKPTAFKAAVYPGAVSAAPFFYCKHIIGDLDVQSQLSTPCLLGGFVKLINTIKNTTVLTSKVQAAIAPSLYPK